MKKIVFASDFHLGTKGALSTEAREKNIVRWMNEVAAEADEIFFLGDVFDFWYEYRSVVPKGFTRFLGALATLADSGKPIHMFTGNHDMWIFEYFTKEFGIPIYREPAIFERQGKLLYIGHGDGLGPGDLKYKILKKIFNNPLCIRLFHWIHPSIGMGIANLWSRNSRASHRDIYTFHGPEKEHLIRYCHHKLNEIPNIDYFLFGHRHIPVNFLLNNGHTRYINSGDWLVFQSYVTMEEGILSLHFYENEHFNAITNNPASWNKAIYS